MSNWFKVPGQGCPVALGGVQCDTNLDCAAYAQQNPQCSSLSTTGTGLGWTDSGAISSSSAGNLTCNPFRKVCEMYTNDQYTRQSSIPLCFNYSTGGSTSKFIVSRAMLFLKMMGIKTSHVDCLNYFIK